MSKKINQLDAISNTDAKNDSFVLAQAHPTTGLAKKITVAQAKEVFATKAFKYTATGSEGTTLTIAALSGYQILAILRESGPIFEVGASPASAEYTWDDTDIVLGTPVGGAGERFLILYRTY
jgi:hypothetical protein